MEVDVKMKKGASHKKAQAALEFLTTYGWAFLVILIMIGALTYFGVLKPSKLLPERCNFGAEIDCSDFQIDYAQNQLSLRLKNNLGDTINATNINATSETATPISCTVQAASADSIQSWPSGAVKDVILENCGYSAAGFVAGDKGKVNVLLQYYTVRSGPSYEHDVQGEVYATVK